MARAKHPPSVLGSTAATRRQWLHLWSATAVLSVLNWLLFSLISGQPGAILPGCAAVVLGAGLQALVFAERAFAGMEARWALSSRRENAVLFGARFRPNIRFLSLYERLGSTGVWVRGAGAMLLSGIVIVVLVRQFHVGFAALLLAAALAGAMLPALFWGAVLLGAGLISAAAQQRFGTAAWPTLFVLAAAGGEIIYFIWLQANMQEQVRFANEITPRDVVLRQRAWLSSAVVFGLVMVIVFAFCQPRSRLPRPETVAGADLVSKPADVVPPEKTDTRPATGGGGQGDLQAGRGRGSGLARDQGGDLATRVCRLLPLLCQPASAGQGSSFEPAPRQHAPGGSLRQRSALPLPAGEGRGEGPQGEGQEATSQHPRDIVLPASRGQSESLDRGGDPGAMPANADHGEALGRGTGQDEAPGRSGGAGGSLRGGVSQGERLPGPGGDKTGGNVRRPTSGAGGPALAEQPSAQTDKAPPPNVAWPELKLDYTSLAVAALLVLVLTVYLWRRHRRQAEQPGKENDQENVKLSPDQVRSAMHRFRQQCQELLDVPIRDESDFREKVIEIYNFLLAHFEACGVGKPPYFTPDEYSSRESAGRPALRDELSHVTTTFNRALYGLIAPPPDEFKAYIRDIARLGSFVQLY